MKTKNEKSANATLAQNSFQLVPLLLITAPLLLSFLPRYGQDALFVIGCTWQLRRLLSEKATNSSGQAYWIKTWLVSLVSLSVVFFYAPVVASLSLIFGGGQWLLLDPSLKNKWPHAHRICSWVFRGLTLILALLMLVVVANFFDFGRRYERWSRGLPINHPKISVPLADPHLAAVLRYGDMSAEDIRVEVVSQLLDKFGCSVTEAAPTNSHIDQWMAESPAVKILLAKTCIGAKNNKG